MIPCDVRASADADPHAAALRAAVRSGQPAPRLGRGDRLGGSRRCRRDGVHPIAPRRCRSFHGRLRELCPHRFFRSPWARGADVRCPRRAASSVRELLLGDCPVEWGLAAGRSLLDGDKLPDGIVCGNDLIAAGVLRQLTLAGVRVPDDVLVTGFDDVPAAALVTPSPHDRAPAARSDRTRGLAAAQSRSATGRAGRSTQRSDLSGAGGASVHVVQRGTKRREGLTCALPVLN